MTLRRTAILRARPDADYLTVPVRKEPKPAKGPRQKLCACCRVSFVPMTPMGRACSIKCAISIAEEVRKKAERKDDRERKQALKRRADHLADAQTAFNAFVRARDADLPCICCGKFSDSTAGVGGKWDAGHYLSRGSHPHLRFDERNVFKQRKGCNRPGGTTAASFRLGVISRIGLAAVEALEADNEPRKYTVEQLIEIKMHYKARLRALTKGE